VIEQKTYFHIVNGYPRDCETKPKIRELIDLYLGCGLSATYAEIEEVLWLLRKFDLTRKQSIASWPCVK